MLKNWNNSVIDKNNYLFLLCFGFNCDLVGLRISKYTILIFKYILRNMFALFYVKDFKSLFP